MGLIQGLEPGEAMTRRHLDHERVAGVITDNLEVCDRTAREVFRRAKAWSDAEKIDPAFALVTVYTAEITDGSA